MRLKGCESRAGTFRTGELVLFPDCSLASILLALDSGYVLVAPSQSSCHPCLLPLFGPLDDKWLAQTSLQLCPGAWELLGLEQPRENSFQQYLQVSMRSLDFEPRCEAVSGFCQDWACLLLPMSSQTANVRSCPALSHFTRAGICLPAALSAPSLPCFWLRHLLSLL